jgi:hypothetical protein
VVAGVVAGMLDMIFEIHDVNGEHDRSHDHVTCSHDHVPCSQFPLPDHAIINISSRHATPNSEPPYLFDKYASEPSKNAHLNNTQLAS